MFSAVDLGIANDGQRARCEQAAQIEIALFADAAELVLARSSVASAPAQSRRKNSVQIGKPSDQRRAQPWHVRAGG